MFRYSSCCSRRESAVIPIFCPFLLIYIWAIFKPISYGTDNYESTIFYIFRETILLLDYNCLAPAVSFSIIRWILPPERYFISFFVFYYLTFCGVTKICFERCIYCYISYNISILTYVKSISR